MKHVQFRRLFAALAAGLVLTAGCPFTTAAESGSQSGNTPTEYTAEMDLYYLEERFQGYVTMPEGALQSYQIELPGEYDSVKYRTESYGNSICARADENGLVMPLSDGDAQITVTAGADTFIYLFHVHNCAKNYADSVMDAYIAEHITTDMPAREKLEQVCQFAAQYDYSFDYSDYISMVILGEGDCWASVGTVNEMCRRAGLRSRARSALIPPTGGPGHQDTVVEGDDGALYIADASGGGGYYTIKESPVFAYQEQEDGTLALTEYRGFDTELDLPQEIDGKTVTTIGSDCFFNHRTFAPAEQQITNITLHDSVTAIESSAFADMDGLTGLSIPQSVSEIGTGAFYDCNHLHLTVDANNPYYTVQDGILYTKDMKTLICAADLYNRKLKQSTHDTSDKIALTVPDGVERIEDRAFFLCGEFSKVILPESLRSIGSSSFAFCWLDGTVILPKSLESIGCMGFHCTVNALVFRNPDTVIDDTTSATEGQSKYRTLENAALIGYAGSTAAQYAEMYDTNQFYELNEDGTAEMLTGTIGEGRARVFWTAETGITFAPAVRELSYWDIRKADSQMWSLMSRAETVILGDFSESLDHEYLDLWSNLSPIFSSIEAVLGKKGSYAEQFAADAGAAFREYDGSNMPFLGDMNGSFSLELADAVLLLRYLSEDHSLSDEQIDEIQHAYPDLNNDWNSDIRDAAFLLHRLGCMQS